MSQAASRPSHLSIRGKDSNKPLCDNKPLTVAKPIRRSKTFDGTLDARDATNSSDKALFVHARLSKHVQRSRTFEGVTGVLEEIPEVESGSSCGSVNSNHGNESVFAISDRYHGDEGVVAMGDGGSEENCADKDTCLYTSSGCNESLGFYSNVTKDTMDICDMSSVVMGDRPSSALSMTSDSCVMTLPRSLSVCYPGMKKTVSDSDLALSTNSNSATQPQGKD